MMGVRIRAVLNWHPRARECLTHAARNREQLIASNCNEVHSFQVRATGVELPSVDRETRFSRLQLRHQSASGSIRPKRAITSTLNVETEGASLAVRIRVSYQGAGVRRRGALTRAGMRRARTRRAAVCRREVATMAASHDESTGVEQAVRRRAGVRGRISSAVGPMSSTGPSPSGEPDSAAGTPLVRDVDGPRAPRRGDARAGRAGIRRRRDITPRSTPARTPARPTAPLTAAPSGLNQAFFSTPTPVLGPTRPAWPQ